MYKDDENRDVEAQPKQMIRKPKIVIRRIVPEKFPNTLNSIETADPKQCSIEKEESDDDEMDEASCVETASDCTGLFDMHKDDENQDVEAQPKQMIRKPRIVIRRIVPKKFPNTSRSIETATSDSKSSTIEEEESDDDEMDEASRVKTASDCTGKLEFYYFNLFIS
ncbi:hypothetical protein LOAG_10425 [Loa loa]|uniref:Nucleolin-like n=1 Tax=Loa loa TaxID=7209 RepID=A0A1I7W3S2_LOALO|nr:hypothetical protein LOAG_10425 [Loa loa]EFO18075.1 hypothetical protein LOAG_10425 [Loa loa]